MNKMQKLMALGIIALMTCGAQAANVTVNSEVLTETTTFDMTALGTVDWVIWTSGGAVFEEKLGGTAIGALQVDDDDAFSAEAGFVRASWSDGTNVAAATGEPGNTIGNWQTPADSDDTLVFDVAVEGTGRLTVVGAGGWGALEEGQNFVRAALSTGEMDEDALHSDTSWNPDNYSEVTVDFFDAAPGTTLTITAQNAKPHIFGATLGPIPEPATMTLLGLGGLALLRRRRRG